MKFFIASVLAYALVAQAAILPIIPHPDKIAHAVADGVATSAGIAAAGVHAAVHGAEKVGAAVVGTGLGALELGSEVASGIKDKISNDIHGLVLGSHEHIGRPEIIDRPEKPLKEGPVDLITEHIEKEHGCDIGVKLLETLLDFYKGDKLGEGFGNASHEHKEHDSHEHKKHESHEHGKHHEWHKRDKRDSHKHGKHRDSRTYEV